jgi:CubicO group peptidase (beta-lactamase class C family)
MAMALMLLGAVARAATEELPRSSPEAEAMSGEPLLKLTQWIRDNRSFPIFSILISRNGRLVYELYTSGIDPEAAHYQMSVTKSVLATLIGIAIDRHLISGSDAPVSQLLPRALFAGDADFARFRSITLKSVLAMAAVDAPDPPRTRTPEAVARYQRFWSAPNRVSFVLREPLTKTAFQYNDATPMLAVGALQYASGRRALEFAEDALFRPMGFRNYEWMHQDAAGLDNGGYGLRLRPVDMHKLGLLYLRRGLWNGKRLVSAEWIERSFTPWNRSRPDHDPDYGWYWWTEHYAPGWTAHLAKGWKGQRIAVVPEQGLVITMTACIEDGSENEFFTQLVTKVIKPAVEKGAQKAAELAPLLDEIHRGPARFSDFIEYRMVPSITPKSESKPFRPPPPSRTEQ